MRFGVIGTNFITDRLLAAGSLIPEFEVTAVGSRTMETGRAFADKYGVEYVFTDFEEMARSGLIDAAYVATPNSCHARISNLFLRHGIHVLCEKAFAGNLYEVNSMIRSAEENGVFLMEAIKNIYMPAFSAIKDEFARIAPLRRAVLQMNRYSSRYGLYLEGKRPNTFCVELANGAIMDMGVYNIQLAVALFGKPDKVTATGVLLEEGRGVDGVSTVILSYPGFECVCMTSKVHTSHLSCEVGGENGTVTFSMSGELGRLQGWDNKGECWDIPCERLPLEQNQYYELVAFIREVNHPDPAFRKKVAEQERIVMAIIDEARRQMGLCFYNDREDMTY